MTTKITGYAFVQTPEGLRVAYTYSKIDADGNVTASNIRGSYIDESEETAAFLAALEAKIMARMV